jgi:hypothetical protein
MKTREWLAPWWDKRASFDRNVLCMVLASPVLLLLAWLVGRLAKARWTAVLRVGAGHALSSRSWRSRGRSTGSRTRAMPGLSMPVSATNQCWAHPPPCTCSDCFNPRWEARGASLADGFRLRGTGPAPDEHAPFFGKPIPAEYR